LKSVVMSLAPMLLLAGLPSMPECTVPVTVIVTAAAREAHARIAVKTNNLIDFIICILLESLVNIP
jgi:hypothetical protein